MRTKDGSYPPHAPGKAARLKEDSPTPAGRPSSLLDTRVIYCGDCLDQLQKLPAACVDLIYIDPPFNSNRNYEVFWGETKEKRAFEDRHASTQAYIDFMRPRCVELARILKKTGSFYYHCDWHASHYVKVMLDQTFGENNFRNEIVWRRATAKSQSYDGFPNNHDSIFFYAGEGSTFHRQFTPLSEERIKKHYCYKDPDGRRFSVTDLTGEGLRNGATGQPWRGFDPNSIQRHWGRPPAELEQLDKEGRIYWPQTKGAWPRMKRHLEEMAGVQVNTIWDDIPPVNARALERLGYPTQKPLELLERIINASSNPNDTVLDAFCGCGTALVAAQNLGRQWIGIDISPTACWVMAKRLRNVCRLPENEKMWLAGKGFVIRDLPWTIDKLKALPPFEFEKWAVIALGGVPNKTQVGDMGIDGRIFPVGTKPYDATTKKGEAASMFAGDWFPIQVKQSDKVGRPDIDQFEAVMAREERQRGFFVAFGYSSDAETECAAFHRKSGRIIKLITVQEILDEHHVQKM
jgi:DNA modification methylase